MFKTSRTDLELGPVPADEECVQVGTERYSELADEECVRYISMLNRLFPDAEKNNVNFRIKHNPHALGTYKEVVASYDNDDDESESFALYIEHNTPESWNDNHVSVSFEDFKKEQEEEERKRKRVRRRRS